MICSSRDKIETPEQVSFHITLVGSAFNLVLYIKGSAAKLNSLNRNLYELMLADNCVDLVIKSSIAKFS